MTYADEEKLVVDTIDEFVKVQKDFYNEKINELYFEKFVRYADGEAEIWDKTSYFKKFDWDKDPKDVFESYEFKIADKAYNLFLKSVWDHYWRDKE